MKTVQFTDKRTSPSDTERPFINIIKKNILPYQSPQKGNDFKELVHGIIEDNPDEVDNVYVSESSQYNPFQTHIPLKIDLPPRLIDNGFTIESESRKRKSFVFNGNDYSELNSVNNDDEEQDNQQSSFSSSDASIPTDILDISISVAENDFSFDVDELMNNKNFLAIDNDANVNLKQQYKNMLSKKTMNCSFEEDILNQRNSKNYKRDEHKCISIPSLPTTSNHSFKSMDFFDIIATNETPSIFQKINNNNNNSKNYNKNNNNDNDKSHISIDDTIESIEDFSQSLLIHETPSIMLHTSSPIKSKQPYTSSSSTTATIMTPPERSPLRAPRAKTWIKEPDRSVIVIDDDTFDSICQGEDSQIQYKPMTNYSSFKTSIIEPQTHNSKKKFNFLSPSRQLSNINRYSVEENDFSLNTNNNRKHHNEEFDHDDNDNNSYTNSIVSSIEFDRNQKTSSVSSYVPNYPLQPIITITKHTDPLKTWDSDFDNRKDSQHYDNDEDSDEDGDEDNNEHNNEHNDEDDSLMKNIDSLIKKIDSHRELIVIDDENQQNLNNESEELKDLAITKRNSIKRKKTTSNKLVFKMCDDVALEAQNLASSLFNADDEMEIHIFQR